MDRDGLATVPEAAPQATAPAGGVRRGSFRALRSPPFRLVLRRPGRLRQRHLPPADRHRWLVLRLTGSASSLGLVLAAGGLPSLLLGPWGGTIADRVDLRKLLIVTQAIFGVLAGLLWVLAAEGSASVAVIVVINVLAGSSRSSTRRPARRS